MAKGLMQQYYYQPIQNMSGIKPSGRGKKWLAIGGFLLMVGVAYYIYKKATKGKKIVGSVKSTVNSLPLWSDVKTFDESTRLSFKGKSQYWSAQDIGGYVGEATGEIVKGSDNMLYRVLVPPNDRKDMFKNKSGNIVSKAYVLAKATEGYK